MTPTVTKKGSRHYRYYTSMDAIRNRGYEGRDSFVRLNAGMVEGAVVQHIRSLLRTPEIAARAMEAARRNDPAMTENDVVNARSEEHTSELQSLMRTSYAVFCLK